MKYPRLRVKENKSLLSRIGSLLERTCFRTSKHIKDDNSLTCSRKLRGTFFDDHRKAETVYYILFRTKYFVLVWSSQVSILIESCSSH